MADFNRVTELYQEFPEKFRSIMLSTVSTDGMPQASYAPFLMDADKTLYVYVSGLSAHTDNLKQTGRVSVLFIEDEADTQEIFARRRLTYHCAVAPLPRDTAQWQPLIDRFEQRFGGVIGLMKGLPDFQIFRLQPQAGQFVIGFGAAYRVNTDDLNTLEPRRQS
ncbi:MAG: HugZ family protein [Leptolyngbyaceae cyanobacterium]